MENDTSYPVSSKENYWFVDFNHYNLNFSRQHDTDDIDWIRVGATLEAAGNKIKNNEIIKDKKNNKFIQLDDSTLSIEEKKLVKKWLIGYVSGHPLSSTPASGVDHLELCLSANRNLNLPILKKYTEERYFSRNIPRGNKSLPLKRFYRNHEQTDEYYWTGRFSNTWMRFTIKDELDEEFINQKFKVKEDVEKRHTTIKFSRFKSQLKLENRWRMLLSVMLMCSSLERYILNISMLAFRADPTLTPGFPKAIDGTILIKRSVAMVAPNFESLVKGTWHRRASNFKKIFKDIPEGFKNNINELEKIRILRNRIAHEFAQDGNISQTPLQLIEEAMNHEYKYKDFPDISHKRILKYLSIIDSTAKSIDRFLVTEFIGNFELVDIFMEWSESPIKVESKLGFNNKHRGTELENFRRFLAQSQGIHISVEYTRELIKYVNSL